MISFTSEEDRIATLVRAFASGAKLKGVLHDWFQDPDGVSDALTITNSIAETLDGIVPGGRAVLAPLLDDPDPRVRASTGAYLVAQMPDRVLPVLQEDSESQRGTWAGFAAGLAISGWELKQGRPTRFDGSLLDLN